LGSRSSARTHEVGTAGQAEINYKFDTLCPRADKDHVQVRRARTSRGRTARPATFMPKPIFGDNGSGMHCTSRCWKDGEPLF
jgi:glutamine synthetase